MNPQNGGESFGKSRKQEPLGDMSAATTKQMYTEMMQGYSAAVSFVDEQLGRVLDAIDKMQVSLSRSLWFKGIFLYTDTVGFLCHVEWYIR